jgi:hypothetical protein
MGSGGGSNSASGGAQAARSRLAKVLNTAVVLCCVSYLLYVCLLALDPRALLAGPHSAYRLRVHVRGGSGQPSRLHLFRSREQLLQAQPLEQPAVLPGGNQAPTLKADMEHSPDRLPPDPLAIVAEADAQSRKHVAEEDLVDGISATEELPAKQQEKEEEQEQGEEYEEEEEARSTERK